MLISTRAPATRLLRDIAVTRGAFHLGANVRRVLEAHVRLRRIVVDALPVDIDSALPIVGDRLDQRLVGRDLLVAIMQV